MTNNFSSSSSSNNSNTNSNSNNAPSVSESSTSWMMGHWSQMIEGSYKAGNTTKTTTAAANTSSSSTSNNDTDSNTVDVSALTEDDSSFYRGYRGSSNGNGSGKSARRSFFDDDDDLPRRTKGVNGNGNGRTTASSRVATIYGEEHPLDELMDDLETSMTQQDEDIQSMNAKLADIETSLRMYGDRRRRHDRKNQHSQNQHQHQHHHQAAMIRRNYYEGSSSDCELPPPQVSSSSLKSEKMTMAMAMKSPDRSIATAASTTDGSSTISPFPVSVSSSKASKSTSTSFKSGKDQYNPSSKILRILPSKKDQKHQQDARGRRAVAAVRDSPSAPAPTVRTAVPSSPVPDAIIEIPKTSKKDLRKESLNSTTRDKMTMVMRMIPTSSSNVRTKKKELKSSSSSRFSSFLSSFSLSKSVPVSRRASSPSDLDRNHDDEVSVDVNDQESSSSDAQPQDVSSFTSKDGSKKTIRHVTFGADDFVVPPPPAIMYGKRDRSSHTFDESESSGSVEYEGRRGMVGDADGDNNREDNDNMSDLGNTHVSSKTWAFRSRPAKMSLICVGVTLIFLVALVLGQSLSRRGSSSPPAAATATNFDNNGETGSSPSSNTTTSTPSLGDLSQTDTSSSGSVSVSESTSNTAPETTTAEDSGADTPVDIPLSGFDYTADTNFLVGAYYYPWHGDNFHNGDGYVRKELQPPHEPVLGEYNDSDPNVIAKHMEWFRRSNIGLLVTSWWGPNRLEDTNTKDVIMKHEDIGNLKIALHYETSGRLLGEGRDINTAVSDVEYMCENYFNHPNYYKIDGRPVIFIYIARKLAELGTLETALLSMRSAAAKCDQNIYLIGDQVFASAPDLGPDEPFIPFFYFDAVTNYDVYGSSGASTRPPGYAGTDGVDRYYEEQAQWRELALSENCEYIPAVSPGYNDRAVRLERNHSALSRQLTSDAQEGSLFHYQLKQAKQLVDRRVDNMILVNSFNEWHEDTQIEPVLGIDTTTPELYTQGLEYVGYGELYLNILSAATSKNESRHTEFDYLL